MAGWFRAIVGASKGKIQFPLREHDARITGMRKDSSCSWVVFPQGIGIYAIELQIMPFALEVY
jgi:hypothetical protein